MDLALKDLSRAMTVIVRIPIKFGFVVVIEFI